MRALRRLVFAALLAFGACVVLFTNACGSSGGGGGGGSTNNWNQMNWNSGQWQ